MSRFICLKDEVKEGGDRSWKAPSDTGQSVTGKLGLNNK